MKFLKHPPSLQFLISAKEVAALLCKHLHTYVRLISKNMPHRLHDIPGKRKTGETAFLLKMVYLGAAIQDGRGVNAKLRGNLPGSQKRSSGT